jgi:2-keto-3-deoxy-L-fuconate dehydrogenase
MKINTDVNTEVNTDTKTLVITGGSSGIGLAICQRFDDAGYLIFNLDIQSSNVGHFIQVDVTDSQAVHHAIADIAEQHTITTLICNAGKHLSGNIEQTDEATLDAMLALNVKGAYHAIQASLPSMKAARSGSIIIIASEQAIIGKTNSFAYNLTKHALASIAKTTALDYAAFNIRANALCPGTIDTPLYQQAIANYVARTGANAKDVHLHEAQCQPLGRIGLPEEVAAYALFLASAEASFVTGSLQVMDGGYAAQ